MTNEQQTDFAFAGFGWDKNLALALIFQAINDSIKAKQKKERVKAFRFLTSKRKYRNFSFWCACAGLTPKYVRQIHKRYMEEQ